MKFKIDENLHSDAADFFRQQGHDALTVREQGMRGSADIDLGSVCRKEGRAIVTLYLDFSNIRDFPPSDYEGIIVLRLNSNS